MDNLKTLNQRFEAVAWGIILILLSILMIIPGDQNNVFLLGIGIVFIGLNLLRSARGIPMNWFSITLGVLALGLGALSLLLTLTGTKAHFQIDIFALSALVVGLYLLIPAQKQGTPR